MRRASRLAVGPTRQRRTLHAARFSSSSTSLSSSSAPVIGRRSLASLSSPSAPTSSYSHSQPTTIESTGLAAEDLDFREVNGIQSYNSIDDTDVVESLAEIESTPASSAASATSRSQHAPGAAEWTRTSATAAAIPDTADAAEEYVRLRNADVIGGLETSSRSSSRARGRVEPDSWTALPKSDEQVQQTKKQLTTALYWVAQHAVQKNAENTARALAADRQYKLLQLLEPGETRSTTLHPNEREHMQELAAEVDLLNGENKPRMLFTETLSELYPVWYDSLQRAILKEQRLAKGEYEAHPTIRDDRRLDKGSLQAWRERLTEVPADVASVLLIGALSSVIMEAGESGVTVVKLSKMFVDKWLQGGAEDADASNTTTTKRNAFTGATESLNAEEDIGNQALNDMTEAILNVSTPSADPAASTSDMFAQPSDFVREEVQSVFAKMSGDDESRDESRDVETWMRGHRHSTSSGMPTPQDLRVELASTSLNPVESVQFGAYLVKLVMNSVHIPVSNTRGGAVVSVEKALVHRAMMQPPKVLGMIVPHEAIRVKLLGRDRQVLPNDFLTTGLMLPSSVPPKKWKGFHSGGFLTLKMPVLRIGRNKNDHHLNHAPRAKYFYTALNKLGETPWQVNDFVYSVARRSYDHDYELGNMMPSQRERADMVAPKKPSFSGFEGEGLEQYKRWQSEEERCRRNRAEWVSKRTELVMKLTGCEKLKKYAQFWFPYSADFRGRAYPIPSSVNPLQDDLSRGLITFARARPLGKRGLFWLKVHLANCFGVDKVSLKDREAWVDEHLSEVMDCGLNPIDEDKPTNAKWWTQADKPWEALAAIREIALAIQSLHPETYMCKLPVHQDGSCNGLQHYAALGRDAHGGAMVNLTNAEKPRDVYTAVAKLVIDRLEEESQVMDPDVFNSYPADVETTTGSVGRIATYLTDKLQAGQVELKAKSKAERWTAEEMKKASKEFRAEHIIPALGHLMKDRITRKLVKQTVMTTVYGVTLRGAQEQIYNQMYSVNQENVTKRKQGLPHDEILSEDLLRTCANHIANLTLNSIGETFESASAVKVWLKETCGTVVETGNPMQWVTPVGLPVTQPYKISEKLSVRTVMQKVVVVDPRKDHGVNKQKQTTAFAPNFVHSLDAAHMMMTAVECYEQGLDFAAVHDSFWTHAGDVDTMNGILRDQFVNLHSKDHLNRLVNDLRDMYPQCEFKDPPPRGDLDIELVKGSDYFFN